MSTMKIYGKISCRQQSCVRLSAMTNRLALFLLMAAVVALNGCSIIKRPDRVDGKVVLNGLESPDVEGVAATLEKSAKSAEEARDYGRAAQYYSQLIGQDGKNAKYLLGFAENSRRLGRHDVAQATYATVLKLDKDNVNALEGQGLSLLDSGEPEKAGDTFSRVMEKDKTRWRTLNALGILFVMRDRYDDAMSYFAEALAQSRNNAAVLNNVGLSMAINRRYEDAVEALKRANRAVADDKALQKKVDLNLAMVYAVKGDLDRAKSAAGKHLSGPALENNMGFYAHLAKDDVLAKSYLNMALSSNPHYYDRAWRNLDNIKKQENELTQKGRTGGGKKVKVQ